MNKEAGRNLHQTMLTLTWKRLLKEEQTCPRCQGTEEALDRAASRLRAALNSLGIEVQVHKHALTEDQFRKHPRRSNQILVNDKSLADWVGGQVGESACCDVCSPHACRTLEVAGKTHEVIPEDWIVAAGLKAAADQLLPTSPQSQSNCCRERNHPPDSSCGCS